MSIYTELVASKNRFLEYLIDEYLIDEHEFYSEREGKKEFILSYLDKCSFFYDNSIFKCEGVMILHTGTDSLDITYLQENSMHNLIEMCGSNRDVRIWTTNKKAIDFTVEEYKKANELHKIDGLFVNEEPWVNNEHNIDFCYCFNYKDIKNNFISDSKRSQEADYPIEICDNYVKLDIKRGELIVLAGCPGIGKTALAISVLLNKIKSKGDVLYLTIKRTAKSVGQRILGAKAEIPFGNMMDNKFADNQYKRIVQNIEKLEGVCIAECNYEHIFEIERIIDIHGRLGFKMIIIDDFDYIHYLGEYPKTDEEIEDIIGKLKALAKKFNIPIVTTAKVIENVSEREDKKPKLNDLKVNKLGELADKVYMIHRETFYILDEVDKDKPWRDAEIIDVKNNKTINCSYNVLTGSIVKAKK